MRRLKLGALTCAFILAFSSISPVTTYANEVREQTNENVRYSLKTEQSFDKVEKGFTAVNMWIELNKVNSENIAAFQVELQITDENGNVVKDLESLDMEFNSKLTEDDIKEAKIDAKTGSIKLYIATRRNLVEIMDDTHLLPLGRLIFSTKSTEKLKINIANETGNLKTVGTNKDTLVATDKVLSDGTIINTSLRKPVELDKTALVKTISNTEKAVLEGGYTKINTTLSSWNRFEEALNKAKSIADKSTKTTLTQDEVDLVTKELHTATSKLEFRILKASFDALVSINDNAKKLEANYSNQDFKQVKDLILTADALIAIGEGELTHPKDTAKANQLVQEISNAISKLLAISPGDEIANLKLALDANVKALEAILSSKDQYVESTIKELDALINEAKDLLANQNATADQLRTMIERTGGAISKAKLKTPKEIVVPDASASTGDTSKIALFAGSAIISLLGMAAIILTRKKKLSSK